MLIKITLCINYRNTKSSGYLTRKLSLLCNDNFISNTIDDCGSKHYIDLYVDCQKTLNRYNQRNYVVEENGKEVIKTINAKEDQDLIGTTIQLRSPITCALKHGKICKTCYGELWKYNMHKNVGLIAVLILTNQNTQLQLSAKHNLQASINKIEWGEKFLKYFTVNKEQIYLNEEFIDSKIKITIPEFIETDEFDDNLLFNTIIVEEFKKEPVSIDIPKNLILNEDVVGYSYSAKEEGNILNLKGVTENDVMFTYNMNNNELSASLNSIINLIESHSYIKSHTMSEIVNRFVQLLNDSPLIVHGVHVEIILRELCVIDDNNRLLFRDEPYEDDIDYPIVDIRRVTEAITRSQSLAKSLVYQEHYKQLTQIPDTYYKNEDSNIDVLF